jgi:hypothetical protein
MIFRCYETGFARIDEDQRFTKVDDNGMIAREIELTSLDDLFALSDDYDIMAKRRAGEDFLYFDRRGGNFRQR